MNIIEQLKKNEKPFGLMSEEMQEKAKAIGPVDFLILSIVGIAINWPKWNPFCGGDFVYKETYRLRADYEDEPEIVECEIFEDSNCLGFDGCKGIQGTEIANAVNHPGFIGFKFEDGTLRTTPIYYQRPTHTNTQVFLNEDYKVLHATHVLFRRKTKE